MRHMRKKINDGWKKGEVQGREIQPNRQKKKTAQFAMGQIELGKKSQSMRQMHQGAGQEKVPGHGVNR